MNPGGPDKFITEDLLSGRMVDVIDSGEPAIMVCHWPGIYFNGDQVGFNILKEVKKRLDQKYDQLIWMKLSEISRYWAAKELTTIIPKKDGIALKAPFSAPGFTLQLNSRITNPILRIDGKEPIILEKAKSQKAIKSGSWYSDKNSTIFCFDLVKGVSELAF
jgi:hypothetical protein